MRDMDFQQQTRRTGRCIDSDELGEVLGLSSRTIDRLREAGAITYRRFGKNQIRFAPEDVAEYIERCRVIGG